jgi:hypothetical protein
MKDQKLYQKIAEEIHSDSSPVGIDAKKTHIMILMKLEEIQKQLKSLNSKVKNLQ